MRMRPRRRSVVAWNPPVAASGRYGALSFARVKRPGRIRWWLRTGALLSVIGIRRLARTTRTRWRPMFLATGALLVIIGVELSSASVFVPGLLVALFALLKGGGASHSQAAAQLTAARWSG